MSDDTSSIWQRLRTPLIYVVVLLVLVVGMFAVVAQGSGPARSEPAGTIATAEVDGRSVAVVAYKADTMGHFDIFRLEAAGFSTQAEAFDLDTGERIWDTMLMTEFGGTDAEVLGMGSDYVYVRSAKGLLILDAGDGDIVAREAEIAGLGDDYIASFDAYAGTSPLRPLCCLMRTAWCAASPPTRWRRRLPHTRWRSAGGTS